MRKRYIVVEGNNLPRLIQSLDRDMMQIFRARRKYYDGKYAIYMANQFTKDQIISYFKNSYTGLRTITTSGTMKKCKSCIAVHGNEESVVSSGSSLLEN